MDKELIQDYLTSSGMDATQANALARILADMEARLVTKADLATLKGDLTWRFIAMTGFLAALMTLFEVVAD